jgi:hypothetical protein
MEECYYRKKFPATSRFNGCLDKGHIRFKFKNIVYSVVHLFFVKTIEYINDEIVSSPENSNFKIKQPFIFAAIGFPKSNRLSLR